MIAPPLVTAGLTQELAAAVDQLRRVTVQVRTRGAATGAGVLWDGGGAAGGGGGGGGGGGPWSPTPPAPGGRRRPARPAAAPAPPAGGGARGVKPDVAPTAHEV